MVISGNVRYIEMIFSHLSTVEEREDCLKGILSFSQHYLEESQQKTYLLEEIKKSLFVLLNGAIEYELNDWFADYTGYKLKDDRAVVELLESIWSCFYDEPWQIEDECSFHLICAPVDIEGMYN